MNNSSSDSTPLSKPEENEATPVYTLTVDDATRLFADAGTPRSPRTIIRYCAKGHLDCVKTDTQQNERYLISRGSVDRRIEEIRQLAVTRHDETRQDTSGHDAPVGEPPRRRSREDANPEFPERLRKLEVQVRDLEITNRAKDLYLDRLTAERATLLEQVSTKSHRIG